MSLKLKNTPNDPRNESGLIQMTMMGESIGQNGLTAVALSFHCENQVQQTKNLELHYANLPIQYTENFKSCKK